MSSNCPFTISEVFPESHEEADPLLAVPLLRGNTLEALNGIFDTQEVAVEVGENVVRDSQSLALFEDFEQVTTEEAPITGLLSTLVIALVAGLQVHCGNPVLREPFSHSLLVPRKL